jgi:hypothetical protein
MPVRKKRELLSSTKKEIAMLFQRPTFRFLRDGESWAPIADLIFGPQNTPSREEVEKLRQLWSELRNQILEAQAEYRGVKPWACRFDAQP